MMDYQDRIKEEDRAPVEAGQVEQELWELLGELGASTPGEDGTCPLREGDWLCGAEVRTIADEWPDIDRRLLLPGLVLRFPNGVGFLLKIEPLARPREG